MKLPLTASLRPLIAEHRPRVPKLLRALAQQSMLNGRADNRGRPLRSQGAGALPPIQEAVHLLAHNIGGLADAPAEQIRALQQRRADFTKTGALKLSPRHRLHRLPALQGGWQQINHASQALQLGHNTRSEPGQSAVKRRRCRWRRDPSGPADG